ncbi:MBL fold metallo-hydrolase [Ammoniphilus sp. 3BR4]|uniref:MBL fold metallo-hydrolase n=1 Tax=Ammoniphilus sp. 3BR4 TaxID=3158265 RepID=UPI003465BC61
MDQIPKPTAICITHLHADHFDYESIQIHWGSDIPVLVPQESAGLAEKTGLKNVVGVPIGYSEEFCTLVVKAVQSMDGYGTPQVSWIAEGK